MFRFFSLFGKSAAMNAIDDALRTAGVHPLLVPDPVKLTVIRLCKQQPPQELPDEGYGDAAELLAYCVLARDPFIECNGVQAADRADQRVETAIAAGDSPDAKLILLALHAGLMTSEIADRIDVDGG